MSPCQVSLLKIDLRSWLEVGSQRSSLSPETIKKKLRIFPQDWRIPNPTLGHLPSSSKRSELYRPIGPNRPTKHFIITEIELKSSYLHTVLLRIQHDHVSRPHIPPQVFPDYFQVESSWTWPIRWSTRNQPKGGVSSIPDFFPWGVYRACRCSRHKCHHLRLQLTIFFT